MNSSWKRYARIGLALIVAILLIAVLGGSAAASGPAYHTVLPGQTLYSIANMHGISVWSLACANGLFNPNYIYAGMVLQIPYGWYGACQMPYHPPVYTPPMAYHPPVYGCFYRVQWGDTLFSIAWRHGTTWQVLAALNHLPNPNYIFAGMILRLPCGYW